MDVLVVTWAVTGCFDVSFNTKMVKYAMWSLLSAHVFEFKIRADRLGTTFAESSVLQYVSTVDETFRPKAIELARSSSQIPWGHALQEA